MTTLLRVALALATTLLSLQAAAEQSYFGVSYANVANHAVCDQTKEAETNSGHVYAPASCDNDDENLQFVIGVQPWSWLAFEMKYFNGLTYRAELNYSSSTETEFIKMRSALRGASLAAVGVWDFSKHYAATLSAGVADIKVVRRNYTGLTTRDTSGVTGVTEVLDDDDSHDRTPFYGLGLLLRGSENVTLSITAERLSKIEEGFGFDDALTIYSIGFQAGF